MTANDATESAMSDLIDRIKSLRYIHVPQASQLFEEAIAEIERLRLTDAEREAVRFCGELCRMGERADLAATLRGLFERTAVTEPLLKEKRA